MGERWWAWLGGQSPALVLSSTGVVVIAVGLVAQRNSGARLAVGAGLLLAGAFSGRLIRARVGPAGAEIELEQRAARSTTELARAGEAPPALPSPEGVVGVHRSALADDVVAYLTRPVDGRLVDLKWSSDVYHDA